MMVKFTHYLVTRFNVPVNDWGKDKAGQITLDDQWIKHRLELFEKYCVPTIKDQSEQGFLWVIYCDVHSSPKDLQQIKEAVMDLPHATIRTVTDHAHMLSDLRYLLANATTPYIISSRLDNDDGLGSNYIKTIQCHFQESDKLLLNPESGILYDTHEKVMTHMLKSQRNHYTSLIEKKKKEEELLTVLGFPHDAPPVEIEIENMAEEYLWLKIIHQRNVKSKLKGKPVFNANNYFKSLDKKIFPVSYSNTIKYILKRILHKIRD